ncbi:MAG TPA: cytochrome c oxidase subunit II, partial [Tepidisphaeraceae bacterium]|nr:cytochrome c oxidase subunit II [Tepidisphaeraceae bacterium]
MPSPFHFNPFHHISPIGDRVDALFWFLTFISVLITLLVFVLIVWFVIRYRRRNEDEIPTKTPSNLPLEIGWTIATFAIMLVMFFWGAILYIDMKRSPAPAANALEINVVGKQWMWKLQHPGGQREIDELHIPVNRLVKLTMSSEDVIHSFSIPDFRIKQDVVPGSYSTEWFTATRTGRYHLFCQEYCGTNHSQMIGWIDVMTPGDYNAWLAGTAVGESPAVSGAALFHSFGCAQCHGQIAPTLAGLYGRKVLLQDGTTVTADSDYLRESILNAPAKIVQGYTPSMPSYRGQVSEEQLSDLIAYIKSLSPAHIDAGPAPDVADRPTSIPNIPPAKQPPG